MCHLLKFGYRFAWVPLLHVCWRERCARSNIQLKRWQKRSIDTHIQKCTQQTSKKQVKSTLVRIVRPLLYGKVVDFLSKKKKTPKIPDYHNFMPKHERLYAILSLFNSPTFPQPRLVAAYYYYRVNYLIIYFSYFMPSVKCLSWAYMLKI